MGEVREDGRRKIWELHGRWIENVADVVRRDERYATVFVRYEREGSKRPYITAEFALRLVSAYLLRTGHVNTQKRIITRQVVNMINPVRESTLGEVGHEENLYINIPIPGSHQLARSTGPQPALVLRKQKKPSSPDALPISNSASARLIYSLIRCPGKV